MGIKIHDSNGIKIAEVVSDNIVINNVEEALEIIGNLYYQEVDKVMIHEKNIVPDFFDLKSGIAGDILQKFSNYRILLVIVGSFEKYTSKSMNDFIFESNKGRQVNFVPSTAEAIKVLRGK